MSINPTSDIVLDVALAADPRRYEAAVARLRQLKGSSEIAAAASAAAAEATTPSAETTASDRAALASSSASSLSAPLPQAGAPRTQKKPDAFAQLEAFVLQTFITEMLPKNAENVFGKGTAGDVWKSMLAEKLANEIASSGQIGLAKRLAAVEAARTASTQAAAATGDAPPVGDNTSVLGGGPPAKPHAKPHVKSLAEVLPYLQQQVADVIARSPVAPLPAPSSSSKRS